MHLLIPTILILGLVKLQAWELSHRSISPFLTLTYVHGGEDARLTHVEAREFCRTLLGRIEEMSAKNKTWAQMNPNPLKDVMSPGSPSSALNATQTGSIHSDLISLHDPTMVHELMGWVLSLEPKQFWIGGLVKMVRDNFRDQNTHVIQMWTDRTPANFRLIHFDNPELEDMEVGDIKCLGVDYASGKWGVHDCDERMYFVCETIRLPKTTGNATRTRRVTDQTRVGTTTPIQVVRGAMTTAAQAQ